MIRFGIVAESLADARRVTGLADRIIEAQATSDREWSGVDGAAHLDIHGVYRQARARGLRIYGHFNGAPGEEDAAQVRAALLLFAVDRSPPVAVVVARDVDDRPGRIKGFEQAVSERVWPFEVVGALAEPEIEAWLVAACEPESPAEHDAHASIRRYVGFDPTLYPERLTSKRSTDKKDAKRVLEALVAGGREPDERWREASVQRLRERGQRCGLGSYIQGIVARLVPALKARR